MRKIQFRSSFKRLQTFIKTVNVKDNLFVIVFGFFTIKGTGENGE